MVSSTQARMSVGPVHVGTTADQLALMHAENGRLLAENERLLCEARRLRLENRDMRLQNRDLRLALEGKTAHERPALSRYGSFEMTAGTCVGPRPRRPVR